MFARGGRIKTLPPAAEVPLKGYADPFELDWLQAPALTGVFRQRCVIRVGLCLTGCMRTWQSPSGVLLSFASKRLPHEHAQHIRPLPAGAPLKLFLALAEGPLAGPLRRQLMRQNKLPQVGARWQPFAGGRGSSMCGCGFVLCGEGFSESRCAARRAAPGARLARARWPTDRHPTESVHSSASWGAGRCRPWLPALLPFFIMKSNF